MRGSLNSNLMKIEMLDMMLIMILMMFLMIILILMNGGELKMAMMKYWSGTIRGILNKNLMMIMTRNMM